MTFTITAGSGSCTVKYDQAGNNNYNPAPQVTETVTAQKANQAITVDTHAPASAMSGTSFTVAAHAPGGPVTYSSSGGCSNSTATFTMTSSTGTCTVTYNQAGNGNYSAAPQVTETVTAIRITVTVLCSMTKADVEGSAKFAALSPKDQKALDATIQTICNGLTAITPKLTAAQKAVLVAAYKTSVTLLNSQGWLTNQQTTTLKALADQL